MSSDRQRIADLERRVRVLEKTIVPLASAAVQAKSRQNNYFVADPLTHLGLHPSTAKALRRRSRD